MLKMFKKLKSNSGGYVLVYVVLLMAFITCLFAGMSVMLDGRTRVQGHNVSSQQLQVTAQSALGTIVDEFEHNGELKAKLAEYVQGSGQTAEFELTDDTGITDNVTVKITKAEGEEHKARIEVEARNEANTNSVSIAYAIVDYAEPPRGESAGVVDNLIVAFMPDSAMNQGDQYVLCRGNEQVLERKLEGKVIINNHNRPELIFKNGTEIESVIASGDIHCMNGTVKATSEDIDGKIASTMGKVSMTNAASVQGKGINLIAGKTGYEQATDNFTWANPDVKIITGDKGDVKITSLEGTIGSIISGGEMNVTPKDTQNLTINGDVIGTKDITWNERGPGLKTTISGDFLCGENLVLNSKRIINVSGDIAAVGSIKGVGGGGSDATQLTASDIYAGRGISFENLAKFDVGSLLSGANYRNGDGKKTKESYLTGNTNEGGITLKGSNITFARAIINDADGEKNIDNPAANVYQRDKDADFENKFFSLNRSWRNLMKQVEKGIDSEGNVNIAVALEPSEVNPADKLAAFVGAAEPVGGYYTNGNGTLVSHHSKYTVDTSKHILNSTIKSTFKAVEDEFKQSIPDMTKTPDVIIPENLKTQWARVTYEDNNNITVNASGYIQVNSGNCGQSPKLTAVDNNDPDLNVKTFDLNTGANIKFDTTSGKSYDLLLGTQRVEDYYSNTGTGYFPFTICVNQPKENPGFVRFFIPDEMTFKIGAEDGYYDTKNTGDSIADGAIPEVYFFYNGVNRLIFDHRVTKGYIIAPHCLVDLNRARVNTVENKSFEGLIICGNVALVQNASYTRMVYYKPLTHERALTTDIYKYSE